MLVPLPQLFRDDLYPSAAGFEITGEGQRHPASPGQLNVIRDGVELVAERQGQVSVLQTVESNPPPGLARDS